MVAKAKLSSSWTVLFTVAGLLLNRPVVLAFRLQVAGRNHGRFPLRVGVASKPIPEPIPETSTVTATETGANVFTQSPLDDSYDQYADVETPDDDSECMIGTIEVFDGGCLPLNLVTLPRHSHVKVNDILARTEELLRVMHINSTEIELATVHLAKEAGRTHERIFANNYVDLGKIKT
jgi:hypothetical protein